MGFCMHILWTMGSNRLDFGHSDSSNEFLRIFFSYIFVSKNISVFFLDTFPLDYDVAIAIYDYWLEILVGYFSFKVKGQRSRSKKFKKVHSLTHDTRNSTDISHQSWEHMLQDLINYWGRPGQRSRSQRSKGPTTLWALRSRGRATSAISPGYAC